jgi:hypothetical protein
MWECVPVAQELRIPLLDPWGSADPITDNGYRPSCSFRLSLKDGWAGPAFLAYARDTLHTRQVGVLLLNAAWGRSRVPRSCLECTKSRRHYAGTAPEGIVHLILALVRCELERLGP